MVSPNVIGGSPWDEPLDEVKEEVKSQPTVIGDLDYGKSQKSAPALAGPKTLNVPKNVEEKVGAKIDAGKIVPEENQTPQTAVKADHPQTPSSGDDFWHQVYSNENATNTTSTTAAPAPKVPITTDIKPTPVVQPVKPVTSQPTADHLYQPVPPPAAATRVPPTNVERPAESAQIPLRKAPIPPAPRPVAPGNRLKMIIIASAVGLILLLAGGVALTELGIISVGLEKIYGSVRLETLWKGLPENPESAFAMAAIKMKTEENFKIEGDATLTVNKGIKSNIISPLVSTVAYPLVAFKDEELGSKLAAVLAAVEGDVEFPEMDLDSGTTTPEDTSSGSTNSAATAPSSSAAVDGTSGTGTSSSNTVASIEELSADISAKINENMSGAEIKVKSKKSQNSKVDLVYSNSKLYVKTTNDIIYDKKVKGSWIAYDLKKFGNDSPSPKFWSSNFSGSNFSITGNRVGNENINGVRCYRYSGKVNIGNALDSFGLSERSVQSMDTDFWIGVSDHKMYRIEAKIIPNSLSVISRIDLKLTFSEYGNESSAFSVPATSTPYSGSTSTGGQTAGNTANSRDGQRKTDLASIAKALEDYHSAYANYPIVNKVEKISAASGTLYTSLLPTFISVLPIDPQDPTYYYGYESGGSTFTLSAVLENTADPEGKTVGGKHLYFLKNQ